MAMLKDISTLEQELYCSICTEKFDDPRYLSCFHTFCFECVKRFGEGIRKLLCPLCRKETIMPSNGAMGLTTNHLARMMVKSIGPRSIKGSLRPMCQTGGKEHDVNQEAEFYCESCQKAICAACGMKLHRDPRQHETVTIKDTTAGMKTFLNTLLEWGKKEEKQKTERKEFIEMKQQEVTTTFHAIETNINRVFEEEKTKLKRRETTLKQELCDTKRVIKRALQRVCNGEDNSTSLTELNSLAEDILQSRDGAMIEMYQEICNSYHVQKQKTEQNTRDFTGSLDQLTKFVSEIKFHPIKNSMPTPTVGRISLASLRWSVEQVRFAAEGGKPSSIIEQANGLLAVGFSTERNIEVYDMQCQRCRTVGSQAVKSMASLPNGNLVVLSPSKDVVVLPANQGHPNNITALLKGRVKPTNGNISVTTDADGNYMFLWGNQLLIFSKDGQPSRVIPLHLREHNAERVQVQFRRSSKMISTDGEPLEIMLNDGSSAKLMKISMNRPLPEVTEIHLPNDHPDDDHVGAIDDDGNVFMAYIKDESWVSIIKYSGESFSREEEVICGLQVVMDDGDHILLIALNPSCVAMCTPQKLSIFKKDTVEDFVNDTIRVE